MGGPVSSMNCGSNTAKYWSLVFYVCKPTFVIQLINFFTLYKISEDVGRRLFVVNTSASMRFSTTGGTPMAWIPVRSSALVAFVGFPGHFE